MRRIIKLFGIAILATILLSACSKSDNPADNNLFLGTYKDGSISYINGTTNISENDGSILVTKVGTQYNFKFSNNDIPGITLNIPMGDDGYAGSVDGYTGILTINESKLQFGLTKDGATWSANLSR